MVTNPLFDRHQPSIMERERHRRIKIAVWAYAYELEDDSLVSDAEFDRECKLVDLTIDTDRPDLDAWFRENFSPDTGQWIHHHPHVQRIKQLYQQSYKKG